MIDIAEPSVTLFQTEECYRLTMGADEQLYTSAGPKENTTKTSERVINRADSHLLGSCGRSIHYCTR